MKHMIRRAITLAMAAIACNGCSGESLVDTPGTAPELAGNWVSINGADYSGCKIVDETGDLVKVIGNLFVQAQLGADELLCDGKWRPAQYGGLSIEYAAVSKVTLNAPSASLVQVTAIRAFGVVIGSYTVTVEGTYDGNKIVGTMTETSNLPGVPASVEPLVTDIEYVRGDC